MKLTTTQKNEMRRKIHELLESGLDRFARELVDGHSLFMSVKLEGPYEIWAVEPPKSYDPLDKRETF